MKNTLCPGTVPVTFPKMKWTELKLPVIAAGFLPVQENSLVFFFRKGAWNRCCFDVKSSRILIP
jgi:hypothetical protein